MPSKTKSKTTKPKEDDKEQSARFVDDARKLSVDESGALFNNTVDLILSRKNLKKSEE